MVLKPYPPKLLFSGRRTAMAERKVARRVGVDYVACDDATNLILEASILKRCPDDMNAYAVASMLNSAAHTVRGNQHQALTARRALAAIRARKMRAPSP